MADSRLPRSTSAPQFSPGTMASGEASGSRGNEPTSPPNPPSVTRQWQDQNVQAGPQPMYYPVAVPRLVPPIPHTHICCVPTHSGTGMHPAHVNPSQPIYVLAPDGSQLYLLDPSKPPRNEEPPPYLPFSRHRAATVGATPSVPWRAHSRQSDETTPLLGDRGSTPLWSWSEIVAGWRDDGGGLRGYIAPITDGAHWKALAHLIVINFPFNLLVWLPLLVGTLVGTVLLITLPLGAVIWWITLIIARWAAREEMKMQTKYHGAVFPPPRPLFHYVSELRLPDVQESVVVYERRFLKCSWAMFSDHHSYSALAYFLLIKPLVTLFSTILIVVLFPLALVLFPLLPIYLRVTRVWGRYQARVAVENI